jgi:hypothetical protein
LHWYRFKNWVGSIIPRMKCFWRIKILKRNPLWIMAKENHIRTYGDLK